LPILVGGTGLYLRTLLEGIAPIPPIDATIRAAVRAMAVEDSFRALKAEDPAAAARLRPTDTTRVSRALEVVRSTGATLADWQRAKSGGIGAMVSLSALVLTPPRPWLYARCDARFTAMIDGGGLAEAERLIARGLDPQLPVMRAIGVREAAAVLDGSMDRDQALERGKIATRQYAKRQYTWFAHQPPEDWMRLNDPIDSAQDVARALTACAIG
jgi:tRNA dimethylallyltransferase